MLRRIILTVAFLASLSLSAKDLNMGSWQIVPLPEQVKEVEAAPFKITSKTTIYYAAGDEKQKKDAEFLASHIKEVTGIEVKTTDKQEKKQIRLALNAGDPKSEAYSLVVNKNEIIISATSHVGIFYGIQSVMKALPIAKDVKSVSLPAVEVKDAPRFAYRAFMIDVGRHYFSIPYLKKLIDVFAMHNINYFHWHLTEDQGWRLEIKKYPMLTQIGSKRKETILPTNKNEFDGVPVSGYYTQEEAREIVKYAADRYITVIPEVDMPGHMLAALASYPELGCTGGPYEVATRFGVFEDVLCAGKAKTLQFAKDVMNEIMDIFPSTRVRVLPLNMPSSMLLPFQGVWRFTFSFRASCDYALSMFFGNTRFRITASRKTTATQLSANTVRTISGKMLNMPVADVKPRPTLSERLTMTMLR